MDSTARYDAVVERAERLLIGCDFDGTLSPIVADPERAYIHPEAGEALVEAAARVLGVAIVTGRPVRQVLELGDLERVAGRLTETGRELVVLGQYGNERWNSTDREIVARPAPPELDDFRAGLPRLLEEADAAEAWIEEKGLAVGVHTRRTTDPQATFERLLPVLSRAARELGLVVEPGRLIIEVRTGGQDKGQALRGLVEQCGAEAVVFVGDDLGDLPAFDAVADLRTEGMPGLLVCSTSDEETALADRADVLVDGPDGVVGWLRQLAADIDAR